MPLDAASAYFKIVSLSLMMIDFALLIIIATVNGRGQDDDAAIMSGRDDTITAALRAPAAARRARPCRRKTLLHARASQRMHAMRKPAEVPTKGS